MLIIGDYDVDGATSISLLFTALKEIGFQNVEYMIPDRFNFGYNISREVAEFTVEKYHPDTVITVDNGISSIDGLKRIIENNIDILLTDHHIESESSGLEKLESSGRLIVVDPNQRSDTSNLKCLSGVGVIFYVIMAFRTFLRNNGYFDSSGNGIEEPNLMKYMPFVAIGTIADVSYMDINNRILVYNGIQRIRNGKCNIGIKSIFDISKVDIEKCTTQDIGFMVAPRLNATGRLGSISKSIDCLLATDKECAKNISIDIDIINKQRKQIEEVIKKQAFGQMKKIQTKIGISSAICLYNRSWHQGVMGIVATRIKDQYGIPVVMLTDSDVYNELKGSIRSTDRINIVEVLDNIDKESKGTIIKRFGGHRGAAGITIYKDKITHFRQHLYEETDRFNRRIDKNCQDIDTFSDSSLNEIEIHSDGEYPMEYMNIGTIKLINSQPYGRGFEKPVFDNEFEIKDIKSFSNILNLLVKDITTDTVLDATYFCSEQNSIFNDIIIGQKIRMVYSPSIYRNRIKLNVIYIEC